MAEPKRTYVAVQPVEVVNADSITLTIGNIGIKGSSDGGTTFQFVHTDTSGDMQVDILSSALPSGAATLAEQQSQTTLLTDIDNNTDSLETLLTDLPNVIGTPGATAPTKRIQVAGKAATSLPVAVSNGQTVGLYLDEYGRLVLKGYSSSTDSVSSTETSPVALQRADLATYINAVTTTTSGSWVTFTSKSIATLYCLVSAWTSGTVTFAVYRNTSAGDTGQILVHSEVLSAAGGKTITIDGDPGFIKVVVTISDTATATVGYMSKGL